MPPILGPQDGNHRPSTAGIAHTPHTTVHSQDPHFRDEYRRLATHFPRPVAVLGVRHARSWHAITVDSFIDVSYDPPTMAVSVYSGSRMAESLAAARAFALSVLTAEQKAIAQWLGEPGQPLYGVLDSVDTVQAPSGAPLIAGCAAWFDLQIVRTVEIATHDLVVGTVTAVGPAPTAPPAPLLRWAEEYRRPAPR